MKFSAVFLTRCPLCADDVAVEPAQLVRLIGADEGPETPVVVEVDHAPDRHRPYIVMADAHLRPVLNSAGVRTHPDDDPDHAKPAAFVFVLEGSTTEEAP